MAEINFDKFIGLPVGLVKNDLEKLGYFVDVVKTSKPKIITDTELVIKVELKQEKQVLVIVGDFLINIEVKNELV